MKSLVFITILGIFFLLTAPVYGDSTSILESQLAQKLLRNNHYDDLKWTQALDSLSSRLIVENNIEVEEKSSLREICISILNRYFQEQEIYWEQYEYGKVDAIQLEILTLMNHFSLKWVDRTHLHELFGKMQRIHSNYPSVYTKLIMLSIKRALAEYSWCDHTINHILDNGDYPDHVKLSFLLYDFGLSRDLLDIRRMTKSIQMILTYKDKDISEAERMYIHLCEATHFFFTNQIDSAIHSYIDIKRMVGHEYLHIVAIVNQMLANCYLAKGELEKSNQLLSLGTRQLNHMYFASEDRYSFEYHIVKSRIEYQDSILKAKMIELKDIDQRRVMWRRGILILLIILVGSLIYFLYYRYVHQAQYMNLMKRFLRAKLADSVFHSASQDINSMYIDESIKQRDFLAKELHDDICNSLAIIEMKIDTLDKKMIAQEVERVRLRARMLSHNLSNPDFSSISLFPVLASYLKQIEECGILATFFYVDQKVKDKKLLPIAQLEIFRIMQELIRNVLHHSNASTLSITFNIVGCDLDILIEDDGCGFDTNKQSDGMGLQTVRERVRRMNGTIIYESAVGVGTIIHIQLH